MKQRRMNAEVPVWRIALSGIFAMLLLAVMASGIVIGVMWIWAGL